MTIKLSTLKTLCENASPGPWRHYDIYGDDAEYGEVFGASIAGEKLILDSRDNAAFIAALNPQTALKLIEIAEKAKRVCHHFGMNEEANTDLIEALRGVER
jgi:hypothetical protein